MINQITGCLIIIYLICKLLLFVGNGTLLEGKERGVLTEKIIIETYGRRGENPKSFLRDAIVTSFHTFNQTGFF